MMTLEEALTMMDRYYTQMQNCSSTSGRKYNGEHMLDLMETVEEVKTYWQFNGYTGKWEERFSKRRTIKISPVEKAPATCGHERGLYLVGNTTFNPFTNEKFYRIKVGQASDFTKRMKNYATHNPCLWKADFKIVDDFISSYEEECHRQLTKVSFGIVEGTKEWFEVDRDTYLEICTKGFDFFDFSTLDSFVEWINLKTK